MHCGCFEKEAYTSSTTYRISNTSFHASQQQTVGSGAFVGVLGSSQKTQFYDRDVLQFWSFFLVHVFCVLLQSFGHLAL